MSYDIDVNPFPDVVLAMQTVVHFVAKPQQVRRCFASEDELYDLMSEAAKLIRNIDGVGTRELMRSVDAWKGACSEAIREYQEIAIGVASSNIASGVLSFVPLVGVGFAIGGVTVALSTMTEIDKRLSRMNEWLEKGANVKEVFRGVSNLTGYITLMERVNGFPNEPLFVSACLGILIFVIMASQAAEEPTRESIKALIRTSGEALREMKRSGTNLKTLTAQTFQSALHVSSSLAGQAAGIRLLGMMGPRGLSAAGTLAARLGAYKTVHEIVGRFGTKILRTTRILRTMGKVAGAVALGFAIGETISACQTRDQAWEEYARIGGELDSMAAGFVDSVKGFLADNQLEAE